LLKLQLLSGRFSGPDEIIPIGLGEAGQKIKRLVLANGSGRADRSAEVAVDAGAFRQRLTISIKVPVHQNAEGGFAARLNGLSAGRFFV